MTDDVRNIVLGVIAAAISAALGWIARAYLWKRRLRRRQAFYGLPDHAESLLVVNRPAGGPELSVMRHDVFALLELSALIKDCGAHARVAAHDTVREGFGERTEFCVGGPVFAPRAGHGRAPGDPFAIDPGAVFQGRTTSPPGTAPRRCPTRSARSTPSATRPARS
jgi:hypothetical protein